MWESSGSASSTSRDLAGWWAATTGSVCLPNRQIHQISTEDSLDTESVTVDLCAGARQRRASIPETLPDYRTVFDLSRMGGPALLTHVMSNPSPRARHREAVTVPIEWMKRHHWQGHFEGSPQDERAGNHSSAWSGRAWPCAR